MNAGLETRGPMRHAAKAPYPLDFPRRKDFMSGQNDGRRVAAHMVVGVGPTGPSFDRQAPA